ncbi:unnamed protein product, partial [Amoebophrya sp. A120]
AAGKQSGARAPDLPAICFVDQRRHCEFDQKHSRLHAVAVATHGKTLRAPCMLTTQPQLLALPGPDQIRAGPTEGARPGRAATWNARRERSRARRKLQAAPSGGSRSDICSETSLGPPAGLKD